MSSWLEHARVGVDVCGGVGVDVCGGVGVYVCGGVGVDVCGGGGGGGGLCHAFSAWMPRTRAMRACAQGHEACASVYEAAPPPPARMAPQSPAASRSCA
eukprot:366571-Chlamydomonas_euryale.AAC.14